jgi:ketosteroid isomerase-like protein
MEGHENRQVVERFWAAMQTNDFRAVGELLHEKYVLEWPQTGEIIRGRENFPAAGRWSFTVERLVADAGGVATEVTVTDGSRADRAVTFSEVRDGRILRQTEYWPDPYDPPEWRAPWVERT